MFRPASDQSEMKEVWSMDSPGISSSLERPPTILAGLPTAVVRGGTSMSTREPAPTFAPSPILTFPRIVAPAPISTPSPIFGCRSPTALPVPPRSRCGGSTRCCQRRRSLRSPLPWRGRGGSRCRSWRRMNRERERAAPLVPEDVRHPLGLDGEESFVVEEAAGEGVAGGIAEARGDEIGDGGGGEGRMIGVGLEEDVVEECGEQRGRAEPVREVEGEGPGEGRVGEHCGVEVAGERWLRLGVAAYLRKRLPRPYTGRDGDND
ncbi:unnamed protein product [Spirodela intermedia]|uniref:Uncharacterized protein n=1 Tax=Spirodela intermedia TaxID=51605 RepID=A0A7I8JPG6_SPIIN|nr:unnamed protein product [Spirodela intermedia]CAA6671651.1 unnamed protein product [Spirodela intermedia]